MNTCVYDKTDKGREEIATRKYQIPARMRTVLVLIDGKRPLDWLLSNVAGLGMTQQNIDELLAQELIRLVPGSAPAAAMPVDAAAVDASPASARARAMARQAARVAAAPLAAAPLAAATSAADAIDDVIASSTPAPAPAAIDPAEQFRQLYAFYNHNIKAAIGLRGVMLQLKVEKAVGVEGMRELRTPFLEAVTKAKGGDVAAALRGELDAMLGGAPAADAVGDVDKIAEPKRGALDFFNMSGGAVEY